MRAASEKNITLNPVLCVHTHSVDICDALWYKSYVGLIRLSFRYSVLFNNMHSYSYIERI